MLKIFSLLERMLPAVSQDDRDDADWVCDLLRHPDIARMDGRELGDLPFPARPIRKVSMSEQACRR